MGLDLKNKVALVTGGALGIGAEVVTLLLEHGVRVASMDVASQQRPESDTFFPLQASVTSQKECTDALQSIMARWGRLDILVNNAGIMDNMQGVADIDDELWHRVFDVNLNGPMYLMRSGIPLMLKNSDENKGVIINVSSVTSLRGAVSGAAYCTAKTALTALGRNTAWIYRHDGIRCNTVLPGGVHSDIVKNSRSSFDPLTSKNYPQKLMHACMPGMCSKLDVAEAILYLISAPSVNGEELVVDQGWMMA